MRRLPQHLGWRTAPGHEAQVDYGEGPMVRYAKTGKYRRTRLFVLTLGYSRKSIRLQVTFVLGTDKGSRTAGSASM